MPELPEVETIRRGLTEKLEKGKAGKILQVKVFEPKSLIGESSKIVGRGVVRIRRFGKALVFDLSGEVSVICHLRMTGQLVFWDFSGERFGGGHPT